MDQSAVSKRLWVTEAADAEQLLAATGNAVALCPVYGDEQEATA